ncbi:MAG TPA: sigma-54 factor interaction domain-containing protein, partial [Chitinophagales bacterium]|nr:sigma-54 factor interaction domain-containing protein [Chitinophagales bacterium]
MTKGKILVSWYAHNNDFVWEGTGNNRKKLPEVREDGPTMNVHRFFYEGYTKHLLLYSNEKDKLFFDQLRTHIYKEFRHDRHIIEPYLMAVNDPINVEEITHKVEKLIAGLSQYQIDIFISPGTPAMQVAWYITGSKFKAYVNLFQIRPKEFTNDKKQPVKQNITFYLADLAMNLTLTQANIENSLAREAFEITPSLLVVCKKAQQVAFTRDITCLILGEHGTGKELIAKYIHRNSDRRQQPIKAVNCSAFSDDLLRSELFGHEKGAFTGAHDKHIGLIEAADNGTLFLDEIGDISPVMQAALLRFIQLKEFIPVGGNKPKTADVRIVAATNRDLADLCKRGLFRWDLYYRLMVAEIDLPPLRERGKKEIKDMLDYFVKLYSEKYSQR